MELIIAHVWTVKTHMLRIIGIYINNNIDKFSLLSGVK